MSGGGGERERVEADGKVCFPASNTILNSGRNDSPLTLTIIFNTLAAAPFSLFFFLICLFSFFLSRLGLIKFEFAVFTRPFTEGPNEICFHSFKPVVFFLMGLDAGETFG